MSNDWFRMMPRETIFYPTIININEEFTKLCLKFGKHQPKVESLSKNLLLVKRG